MIQRVCQPYLGAYRAPHTPPRSLILSVTIVSNLAELSTGTVSQDQRTVHDLGRPSPAGQWPLTLPNNTFFGQKQVEQVIRRQAAYTADIGGVWTKPGHTPRFHSAPDENCIVYSRDALQPDCFVPHAHINTVHLALQHLVPQYVPKQLLPPVSVLP